MEQRPVYSEIPSRIEEVCWTKSCDLFAVIKLSIWDLGASRCSTGGLASLVHYDGMLLAASNCRQCRRSFSSVSVEVASAMPLLHLTFKISSDDDRPTQQTTMQAVTMVDCQIGGSC
ncbi:hypothetical protein BS78_03G141200 [Paspalum vaginatum]|nr:hypothetical protein BS78_03G141200 [Paspalum vaginatum]